MPVQANIIDPNLLYVPSGGYVESISKEGRATKATLAYTRTAQFPVADGGYAAGVCLQDTLATERAAALRTSGYAILQVKDGVSFAVDAPVCIGTAGQAIAFSTGFTVFGRAVSIANGTGTALKPQYIVVRV